MAIEPPTAKITTPLHRMAIEPPTTGLLGSNPSMYAQAALAFNFILTAVVPVIMVVSYCYWRRQLARTKSTGGDSDEGGLLSSNNSSSNAGDDEKSNSNGSSSNSSSSGSAFTDADSDIVSSTIRYHWCCFATGYVNVRKLRTTRSAALSVDDSGPAKPRTVVDVEIDDQSAGYCGGCCCFLYCCRGGSNKARSGEQRRRCGPDDRYRMEICSEPSEPQQVLVVREPLNVHTGVASFFVACVIGLYLHFLPCFTWSCDMSDSDNGAARGGIWFGSWFVFTIFLMLPFFRGHGVSIRDLSLPPVEVPLGHEAQFVEDPYRSVRTRFVLTGRDIESARALKMKLSHSPAAIA